MCIRDRTSALAFAYGFIEMIGVRAMAEDMMAGLNASFAALGAVAAPLRRAGDAPVVKQLRYAAYGVAGLAASGGALFISFVR